MSVHVISWVLEHSDERLGRRLVLLVLADHAKKDGTSAWPSIDTIAHEARMSRSQVIRCLTDLKDAGSIVARGSSRSGTTIYDITMGSQYATGGGRISAEERSQDATRTVLKATVSSSLQKNGREPNEIWDALAEIFGDPTTRPSMKERGQICRDLKEAGATKEEIFARSKRWAMHFDHATLTAHALVRHWDTLPLKPRRVPR